MKSTWTTSPKQKDKRPISTTVWCISTSSFEMCDVHPRCQSHSRQIMGQVRNPPTSDFKKVTPKSQVVQQAKQDGRSVHFASLMDFGHLKHLEYAKQSPNIQRECRARRENDEHDSGNRTHKAKSISFESGGSKIVRYICKLLGIAGEANAVSAYTQVHMSAAHRLSSQRTSAHKCG